MATRAGGRVEGGMRREGARAQRERRQRAEARMRARLVRDEEEDERANALFVKLGWQSPNQVCCVFWCC